MLRRRSVKSCQFISQAIGNVRAGYHDTTYGFRATPKFELPDYTSAQLRNRASNSSLLRYVDSCRLHGHRAARIDPLDLLQREEVAALDPDRYGLSEITEGYSIDGIIFGGDPGPWSLAKIEEHMRSVYMSFIAYEYMHSTSKTERLWFSTLLESSIAATRTDEEKRRIWEHLVRSELFDQFLQAKFPNLKRYGLEGGESMIPALETLFRKSAEAGLEHVVLCMPHRGRLNLLTDLLKYSPSALFHKIKGNGEYAYREGFVGDVISHLIASPSLEFLDASSPLQVELLPNPSHLEAVNPVALGQTRAKQYGMLKSAPEQCRLGDKVMCVQIHGDASFCGQGIVMETLGLSNLSHYTSGGSVHIIVNNNIGYTTPASMRSHLYCSDIAKMVQAPILHVNGDHPEEVVRAVEFALQYRNRFHKDIVIDMMVYRRWGHNELDEPSFTQPQMYKLVRSRESVPTQYENRLINDGILTSDDASAFRQSYKDRLVSELKSAASFVVPSSPLHPSLVWPTDSAANHQPDTGVDQSELLNIGRASVNAPDNFNLHPRLSRHVKHRLTSLDTGSGIDWATAEALAFGSLMMEGHDIRISGQDVGRGTFSQRHAMLVDQNNEDIIVPLNQLDCAGRLEIANSSLSEMAVLGFEYGMSWERPDFLPIWEAQFGDFFNGAQVVIDTFLASSEVKWLKQSGLIMLLPHGLDGAGPEHSSMRMERTLQLTDDPHEPPSADGPVNVNMHVVCPTTPAQYFHLLRRQLKRNYRKPLVVAGPKTLLRLPAASSTLADMGPGTRFKPVLVDERFLPSTSSSRVPQRVIVVSGKLYYDLLRERASRGLEERVAIVRLEQLCPFPFSEMRELLLSSFNDVRNLVWVQEEPRNQGAAPHVLPRLVALTGDDARSVRYVGRRESAVPAPGIGQLFKEQQAKILQEAFAEL